MNANRSPEPSRGRKAVERKFLGLRGLKQRVGPPPRVSESILCFSNKFPSEADAADPGPRCKTLAESVVCDHLCLDSNPASGSCRLDALEGLLSLFL